MKQNARISLACLCVLCIFVVNSLAEEATIHIDAAKVSGRVGRYLAGACIEDVNHEIYGGIYSQMIFGESFQEPPLGAPLKGFRAYGGRWIAEDGQLWRADGGWAETGERLIRPSPRERSASRSSLAIAAPAMRG